jgi:hypothetical protein
MDSDKFDRVVLDLLYGELDELTTAAAKRHMDQSARARDIYAHFRATRQLGVLPPHPPPANFETLVLAGEARILSELPLPQRIGRLVSRLAGYAMRPQLIMGALLLLMIGSSLMFLRARPGLHTAVQVTERGAPEADADLVLPLGASQRDTSAAPLNLNLDAAGPAAANAEPERQSGEASGFAADGRRTNAGVDAGAEGVDPFDQAVQVFRAGGYAEAQRLFERLSKTNGKHSAEAALYSVRATRNLSGCAAALPGFERVQLRYAGSMSAHEAAFRAAACQEQLGNFAAARQGYESLRHIAAFSQRSERALEVLGERGRTNDPSPRP